MFVKICGITNEDDALLAVAMGADALGFVFAPSTRQVTASAVADIVKRLPNDVLTVGVFRDEAPERVVETIHRAGLRGAQLHGHETREATWWVGERIPFVIKAFVAGDRGVADASGYRARRPILLDAPSPGSGNVFDWRLADGVPDRSRLIVAGGLDSNNVAAAIAATHPWGVDVSTGVEIEPGRKDPRLLRAFIANAQAAFAKEPTRARGRPGSVRLGRGRRHMTTQPSGMAEPSPRAASDEFGGRYVPESLMPACLALEAAFREAWSDPAFIEEYRSLLRDYAGRPTPVTECARLSEELGVRVLLKREDLAHTGSHKINNVVGQALLTRRMGKTRIVAETGAGQHGVATATAAALFGLECVVYMGEVDVERQALNVFRMQLLGAVVRPVGSGSRTLKDAINEAMRDWVANVENSHYCLGSVMGPHPYPWMVREFQRIVGEEARGQVQAILGADPDVVVACVGGGSNAAGTFAGFVDTDAQLVGVEPAGGAAIGHGVPGVVHGSQSMLLQDEDGQITEAHSISAGLDYPGVGPEHAYLASIGRAQYVPATDDEVLDALQLLARTEGIIPALESAHAIAWVAARGAFGRAGTGHDGAGHVVGPRRQRRRASHEDPRPAVRPRRMTTPSLEPTLRQRRDEGRRLLVPYVTGGLGGTAWIESLEAMAASGADAIEIGFPFSDPVMDGPTIQEASQKVARRGHDAGEDPGVAAWGRHRRAARSDDVLQPRVPHGPRAIRLLAGRGRHHRCDLARPAARGIRRVGGHRRRARRRPGAPRVACHARRSARSRSPRARAVSSTACP